ncbi:MAG: hypothetical protein ACREAD_04195 [Nitrosopumilaceae archaeon]
MAEASTLFSSNKGTNFGKWGHGEAFVVAGADAVASLRRGINLSAQADIEGGLDADVHNGFAGTFKTGASAKAEISLTAAFPLDLFEGAGLIVRLAARAQASAFVELEIGIDNSLFEQMLHDKLNNTWAELADIFIDETSIEAGIWASASLSIMAYVEAALAGCFLPSPGNQAGFTCSFGYGVGFVKGVGKQFLVSINFKDSSRLLDRLSDKMVSIIEDEITQLLPSLQKSDAVSANRAMTYLKFILPLVSRTGFELGSKMISGQITDYKTEAITSFVRSFAREGTQFLIKSISDMAISKITDKLNDDSLFTNALLKLAPDKQDQFLTNLVYVDSLLIKLTKIEHASVDNWFSAVDNLIEPLMGIVASDIFGTNGSEDAKNWKNYVSLFWTSAVLMREITQWATTSTQINDPTTTSIDDTLAQIDNTDLASTIASQITTSVPGMPLVKDDIINLVLSNANLGLLQEAFPELVPLVQFLSIHMTKNGKAITLLQALIDNFGEVEQADAVAIKDDLLSALTTIVQNELIPNLFEKLKISGDPEVVEIIETIVEPAVKSLTGSIIPNIFQLSDDESARKLRELVSAVLLQLISKLILTSTDALLDKAMNDAKGSMNKITQDLRDGKALDVLNSMSPFLAHSSFGMPTTAKDIADILDLAADAIGFWNTNIRPTLFSLTGQLLSLGIGADDIQTNKTLSTISNSSDPPLRSTLESLTLNLVDAIIKLFNYLIPKIAELLLKFLKNVVDAIINLVKDFVKSALDVAVKAIQSLEQAIVDLDNLVQKLKADIEQYISNISTKVGEFAAKVITFENNIVDNISSYGWNQLIQPILFDNELFQAIPFGYGSSIEDLAYSIYLGVFNTIKYLLDEPLKILQKIAYWVHDLMIFLLQAGTLDKTTLINTVRQQALNSFASDLSITIDIPSVTLIDSPWPIPDLTSPRINLGTFTIPSGQILGEIINYVFQIPEFDGFVEYLIQNGQDTNSSQSTQDTTQKTLDNDMSQQQAMDAIGDLTTDKDLQIEIKYPKEGEVYKDIAPLTINLTGATSSFVSDVLGVPKRVKIIVNGVEYPYASENWVNSNDVLVFEATLSPTNVGLVPVPISPPYKFSGVTLSQDLKFSMVTSKDSKNQYALVPDNPQKKWFSISPSNTSNSKALVIPSRTVSSASLSALGQPLQQYREHPTSTTASSKTIVGASTQSNDIVVLEKTSGFFASPKEKLNGFRLIPPGKDLNPHEESIILHEGLNTIQVIVLDGTEGSDLYTNLFTSKGIQPKWNLQKRADLQAQAQDTQGQVRVKIQDKKEQIKNLIVDRQKHHAADIRTFYLTKS